MTVEIFPAAPPRRVPWAQASVIAYRPLRHYVRLVADNGETLATSEAYASRWNAKRAARKNFPGLEIKEVPS